MANPKFLASEMSLITYTMSATEDANYPLSNLKTDETDDLWKSSAATANQWLRAVMYVSFGSDSAKDFIVVHNHNFQAIYDAGGQVKIQSSHYTDFSTEVITHFDSATDAISDAMVLEITSTTWVYFRILYVSCGGVIPSVGNFWIGKNFDPGFAHAIPFKGMDRLYESDEITALDGRIRNSTPYGFRYIKEIQFTLMNNTFRDNWRIFYQIIDGKRRPFYFIDTDGNYYYVQMSSDDLPVETIKANLHDSPSIVLRSHYTY